LQKHKYYKNTTKLKQLSVVNLDFAQALEVLQTVVVYLKGFILSHALAAVGFEA
jgi:hypothetical protein